ncbi:unnamed protein product [Paramecium pentaurelia]|uniref:Transmembrane protein n=1 Tax=Paramecium pentaurelia TaxID=43138 RepID=A0A8S1XI53_9CILI|nr:unnamed protein product [Paramecium pentaurelia]
MIIEKLRNPYNTYTQIKDNPKLLFKISFYSFALLLLSQLPPFACVCLIISYLTGKKFFEIYFHKHLKEGIMEMFPQGIRDALMKRSIFDLLCDIWFMPKFSLYIRAFLKPFVANIDPENAEQALEGLPLEDRQIITKKGIINTLPMLLQTTVDTTQQQINDSEVPQTPHTPSKIKQKKTRYDRKQYNRTKSKRVFKEDKIVSTFKMPWTIVKTYEEDRASIMSSQSDIDFSNKQNFSIVEEMKPLPSLQENIGFKNIELVLKPQTSQEQIKWDNLDNFYNQVKDTVPGSHKRPLEMILKITNLINNIVHFEKRSKQILAINNNALIKAFIISAAALAFQSYISTRTRRLMMQTIMIICYLGSAGIATGTLGLCVVKFVNQNKKKRN